MELLCGRVLKHSFLQLSEDQDMKGAAGRRSQSPIDHPQYYASTVDSQRGTPVGASDDESTSRSANGTPHSIVQIPDDPVNIYDNTSLKRTDSLQGKIIPYNMLNSINIP